MLAGMDVRSSREVIDEVNTAAFSLCLPLPLLVQRLRRG